jgi:hypothetical protein
MISGGADMAVGGVEGCGHGLGRCGLSGGGG